MKSRRLEASLNLALLTFLWVVIMQLGPGGVGGVRRG